MGQWGGSEGCDTRCDGGPGREFSGDMIADCTNDSEEKAGHGGGKRTWSGYFL